MNTVLLQIAPQRSTQYSALAETLAPHELHLSALGARCAAVEPVTLGGQRYLRVTLSTPLALDEATSIGDMACFSAAFDYVDSAAGLPEPGPWLRPISLNIAPPSPLQELPAIRRYRGKTNELFTRFMLNIARHSSAFAAQPWASLRVLDPLAGGGTTIFSAAALGASAIGIEKSSEDVHGAVTFLKQFLREAELDFQEREERLKGVGRRWRFDLGAQHCVFAAGESADCVKLLNGFKKSHVIVTDLPYGIQHRGTLTELLALSLPAWHAVLEPGGAMVFSWDATRVRRESMVAAVHEALPAVRICAGGAYDMLAHPVDRVIKRRDMLVLRLSESP